MVVSVGNGMVWEKKKETFLYAVDVVIRKRRTKRSKARSDCILTLTKEKKLGQEHFHLK